MCFFFSNFNLSFFISTSVEIGEHCRNAHSLRSVSRAPSEVKNADDVLKIEPEEVNTDEIDYGNAYSKL